MIGKTISRYKILDKLGEGGMGVVYKAEDTKLDRPVALKLLPAHLLGNEDIRRRFEREAKSAAALDHPHVCHVYEIDEADGQVFIAMSLIEGESLDQKIARGPLKLDEALSIAQQAAKGLEAAHKRGIIHRDIKPENIMVGEDGHVTIMDFGLAQLAEASRLTKTDETVGTVAYMSPEQTEGSGTDHRADIWSLGVVLYEMVTGQPPFKGDYDKAVMYSILNEEPEPITALRTGVPMRLEQCVTKCLAKSVEDRYQHADDLRVDLRSLLATFAEKWKERSSAALSDAHRRPTSTLLPWAFAAVLTLLLAVQTLRVWSPGPEARNAPVYRFEVLPPDGVTIRSFELSPDGRHLAFVGEEPTSARLWLHSFDEGSASPVPGAEYVDPIAAPFWSPDSRSIGFFAQGKLKKVDLLGTPPIDLTDAPHGRGGSWNSDGQIVFAPTNIGPNARLLSVSVRDGNPQPATMLDSVSHRSPFFLPDGTSFLFSSRLGAMGADYETRLGSVGSLESRVLTTQTSHSVAVSFGDASPGRLLFNRGRVLMAQRFDLQAKELIGEPFPVLPEVGVDDDIGRALFSISASGMLAYSTRQRPWQRREVLWLDRRGKRLQSLGADQRYWGVRIDPDQSRVAISRANIGTGSSMILDVLDLKDGSSLQPYPLRGGHIQAWSPDGKSVALSEGESVLRVPADGSTEPIEMFSLSSVAPRDWSPDGSQLILEDYSEVDDQDLLIGDLRTGVAEPFLATAHDERYARFSPNGKFIAYSSDESGREEVYVIQFPGAMGKKKVSFNGGLNPVWRPDGKELFFVSPNGVLMATEVEMDGETFEAARPQDLFTVGIDQQLRPPTSWFDVSADGQRFLVTRSLPVPDPSPIHIVLNWFEELRDGEED